jgi:PAS domain S-box-containing protein
MGVYCPTTTLPPERYPNGLVWLLVNAEPQLSSDGTVQQVIVTLTDITYRKRLEIQRLQAEQALRQSEQRLQTVIDSAPIILYAIDRQGRFTLSEGKGLAALGLQPGEVVGESIYDLYRDLPEILSQVECALSGKETQYQATVQGITYQSRFCPLQGDNHEILGFTGVSLDITELKRAEEEICKALQKEKELNELKSRFVSMISHEFRTPLAVIQSAADLLQNYEWSADNKREYFNQIHTAIEHMTHLLEDVLWIGKLESGTVEINLRSTDLTKFCCSLVAELELAYGENYRFRFETYGKSTPVALDQKLLRQILTNLLSNAAKYSAKNSDILLRLDYQPEQVVLQVQDYGIGIPKADQEGLFEAFRRASNVGTIQGTGLGLAIVKRCVDLHQGHISLKSQLGIGTTFTITLPKLKVEV